jgi:hypothetical protein
MSEDDYLQVEIVPFANLNFARQEALRVAEFAEKHWTGNGYTAITTTENLPYVTATLGITIADLENILADYNFNRIKSIHYLGGGMINYKAGKTRAYGDPDFSIWAEVNGELVENIWLTSIAENSQKRITDISALLNLLGTKYGLIVADWNACYYRSIICQHQNFITYRRYAFAAVQKAQAYHKAKAGYYAAHFLDQFAGRSYGAAGSQ